ncbi:39S ribosomal protein L37, mitochondrial [Harpegnathos saltator]|uniref:Large ribosomal subunit protein mL37 n=1 Tax=Harpegnathos saltator TaxID=610380 RepID=E2C0C1_HARSA|nr:39S ribosomal protein L37, mitochondrial [Harpegnathos saltator]EFN78580.1 39S ribosomal protein L37, mitochondrial [Harpegnathos saltator]
MKFTQILFKQHLDRMFKRIWHVKRNRNIRILNAEEYLSTLGFKVKDPLEIVKPKQIFPRIPQHELPPLNVIFNETHPDWKVKACLTFKDHNVLQQGLSQAQILTNTVCLSESSSSHIANLLPDLPENIDDIVKRAVYASNIFDAHQEKLPKRKDPNRPAWVFPRDYGITNARKMQNMSRKFVQLCESLSGTDIAQKRCVLYDAVTKIDWDKESDLFQFTLRSDVMIMSLNSLKPIESSIDNIKIDLPNIYPMHHTVSFDETNFYKIGDIYPVSTTSPWINIHTIFVHYDPEEVKNLTELAVREDQIFGRAMLKSYTVAVSCARQRFGLFVKKLPEPVTVQCIHTDGKHYHFFIYQLNSLDTNDNSTKNFWCTLPPLRLFRQAQYDNGRPVIEDYNPEVFRRILAFYRNGSSSDKA